MIIQTLIWLIFIFPFDTLQSENLQLSNIKESIFNKSKLMFSKSLHESNVT